MQPKHALRMLQNEKFLSKLRNHFPYHFGSHLLDNTEGTFFNFTPTQKRHVPLESNKRTLRVSFCRFCI